MLRAVMNQPGSIQFETVDTPSPNQGEVLIRVNKIGVCGSDIHVYHGLHPYTSFPVIQGHEVSGTVESKGSKVSENIHIGDLVTFMPQITCNECQQCISGSYHICENLKVMGFQADGAAQEFFTVPENNLIKLPAGLSSDIGAMIEPISVAVHAIRRSSEKLEAKNVLVLGAGPIGNLTAQVAKANGANVMITDISEFRLNKALDCGIDHAVHVQEQNLEDALNQTFGASKADLIFECVGVQETITDAISVARKGTSVIIVGVFGQKPIVDLGLVQDRELTLIGTLMYKREDYEEAVELCNSNQLSLDPMITNYFDFKDYLKAYQFIEKAGDKTLKVMINISDS